MGIVCYLAIHEVQLGYVRDQCLRLKASEQNPICREIASDECSAFTPPEVIAALVAMVALCFGFAPVGMPGRQLRPPDDKDGKPPAP